MTETAIARRSPPAPLLLRLLSCIRFDEVCALQGASLIGASLSIGGLTEAKILAVVALVAGNLCLVAHVFVFNDWSGIHGDLKDPNRAHRTFVANGISRGEVGFLAISLLALSLLIFGLAGATVFVLAVAIASLSALYSAPALHMKGTPLLSSALHLVGGALHFLLGYAIFAPIDARALAVSCFFALVFTAGHFTHEARDREGDMLNGIRTNAVAFGKRRGFLAGLCLFTGAYALLVALAAFRIVPFVLVLAAVLYPAHLLASLRALRAGLTFESLSQLQATYRRLFGIIGVVMIVALWLPR